MKEFLNDTSCRADAFIQDFDSAPMGIIPRSTDFEDDPPASSYGSGGSLFEILCGDVEDQLRTLPGEHAHTCITSPPYFGLRDYGVAGQVGLESTIDEYMSKLVRAFREVHRVLRHDGTLWIVIGDSYDRNKNLLGVPWQLAFALKADGWILRQELVWNKPNCLPESVRDRCTRAHETIFMLTKSKRYYFDAEAIAEPATTKPVLRDMGGYQADYPHKARFSGGERTWGKEGSRNKRSVWTIPTRPSVGGHFAVFPPDLIRPCVLAGAPQGGLVLDPFSGTATTGAVALEHGRRYVGVELNPRYVKISWDRLSKIGLNLAAAANDNDPPISNSTGFPSPKL